jgi:hypothetical protein
MFGREEGPGLRAGGEACGQAGGEVLLTELNLPLVQVQTRMKY